MNGDNHCVKCEQDFSEQNPCCCDSGLHEDGSHEEGYCKGCCPNQHLRMPSWGHYERMDCDQ